MATPKKKSGGSVVSPNFFGVQSWPVIGACGGHTPLEAAESHAEEPGCGSGSFAYVCTISPVDGIGHSD